MSTISKCLLLSMSRKERDHHFKKIGPIFQVLSKMSKCVALVPFDRIIRNLFVRAPSKDDKECLVITSAQL